MSRASAASWSRRRIAAGDPNTSLRYDCECVDVKEAGELMQRVARLHHQVRFRCNKRVSAQ
uniref:Uncharacterized protein n=3 Tax=Oryza TaxID=4527 RepID=A0A0D3G302_9ORYZ